MHSTLYSYSITCFIIPTEWTEVDNQRRTIQNKTKQKNKQWYTKHYIERKRSNNTKAIKTWGELRCFGTIEFNTATFYWSVCTKQGKWAVMYMCNRGIDFASIYTICLLDLGTVQASIFLSPLPSLSMINNNLVVLLYAYAVTTNVTLELNINERNNVNTPNSIYSTTSDVKKDRILSIMWSKLVIASGMIFCDIVLSSLFSIPEKKIVGWLVYAV